MCTVLDVGSPCGLLTQPCASNVPHPPPAVTESYAGAGSPATVSKPAPAGAASMAGAASATAAGAGAPAPQGAAPAASPAAAGSASVGSAVAAAAAGASPLSFTLRLPADSSANFSGGEQEQRRELLAAFERALPGTWLRAWLESAVAQARRYYVCSRSSHLAVACQPVTASHQPPMPL